LKLNQHLHRVYLIKIKTETFTKTARSRRDANVRFGSKADIHRLDHLGGAHGLIMHVGDR